MSIFPILPSSVDNTLLCSFRDLLLCVASSRALSQNCFSCGVILESSVLVDGLASWDMLEPAVSVSVSPPEVSFSGNSLAPADSPEISAVEGRVSGSNS